MNKTLFCHKMEIFQIAALYYSCCILSFGMAYPLSDYPSSDYSGINDYSLDNRVMESGDIDRNTNDAQDYLSNNNNEDGQPAEDEVAQLANFIDWALNNGYSREDTDRFLEQYFTARQQTAGISDSEEGASFAAPHYDVMSNYDVDDADADLSEEKDEDMMTPVVANDDELLDKINQYYGYGISDSDDISGEDNMNSIADGGFQANQADYPTLYYDQEDQQTDDASQPADYSSSSPSSEEEEQDEEAANNDVQAVGTKRSGEDESDGIKLHPGIVEEHTSDTKKQLMARREAMESAAGGKPESPSSTTTTTTKPSEDLLAGKRGMAEKPEYIQTHEDPSKSG